MAKNYTKKVWVNDQTKLSAKNLNHIENGIEAVADKIDTIEENIHGIGNEKQDLLVSGVNIQSINGKSILGPGDFKIKGHEHSNLEVLEQIDTPFTQALKNQFSEKSVVGVSFDGTATDTVQYITIDGHEYKLAGGSSIPDYYERSNVSLDNILDSGVYRITNANKNPDNTAKNGILNVTKLSNGMVEQEWFSSTNSAIRILDPSQGGLEFYVNDSFTEQGEVHLDAGGTYRLRGDLLGHVIIGNYEETVNNRTKVILEGVNIQSKTYPSCIEYTPNAGKLVVEVADTTENYLVVNVEGSRSDDDLGALHSENNLMLNGVGYLTIINKKGHGIKASELIINGDPHMYLNTNHDAIHGGKLLRITNGYFEVNNANDAFSASSGKNDDGKLLILGGEYIINNCVESAFEGKSANGIKRIVNSKITFNEGVNSFFTSNHASDPKYEIKVSDLFNTIVNNTEKELPDFVSYRELFGTPRILLDGVGIPEVAEQEIVLSPTVDTEYVMIGDFTGKRIITNPASGVKVDFILKDVYYESDESIDETHPFWQHTGDKRLKLSLTENCLVLISKANGDIITTSKNLQIKGKGDLILAAPQGTCLKAPGYMVVGGDGARYIKNSNYGIESNSLRLGEDPDDVDEKFDDNPSKRGVSDTAIYVYDNYEYDIKLNSATEQTTYQNQIIATQYFTGCAILENIIDETTVGQVIAQKGQVLQTEGTPYENIALIYAAQGDIAKNEDVHTYIELPYGIIETVPEIEDLAGAWTVYAGDGYSKAAADEKFVAKSVYDALAAKVSATTPRTVEFEHEVIEYTDKGKIKSIVLDDEGKIIDLAMLKYACPEHLDDEPDTYKDYLKEGRQVYARDGDFGFLEIDGQGQVNISPQFNKDGTNPDGLAIYPVNVEGVYNKFKSPWSTGIPNDYRFTKVSGNLNIKLAAAVEDEMPAHLVTYKIIAPNSYTLADIPQVRVFKCKDQTEKYVTYIIGKKEHKTLSAELCSGRFLDFAADSETQVGEDEVCFVATDRACSDNSGLPSNSTDVDADPVSVYFNVEGEPIHEGETISYSEAGGRKIKDNKFIGKCVEEITGDITVIIRIAPPVTVSYNDEAVREVADGKVNYGFEMKNADKQLIYTESKASGSDFNFVVVRGYNIEKDPDAGYGPDYVPRNNLEAINELIDNITIGNKAVQDLTKVIEIVPAEIKRTKDTFKFNGKYVTADIVITLKSKPTPPANVDGE